MQKNEKPGVNTPKELGRTVGSKALNPLAEFLSLFGDSGNCGDRDQFIVGYLEGVTQFFEQRGLVMPIGSYMEDIRQQQGLVGFIKGLNREKPNPRERLTPPSGEYSDPAIEEYTFNMIAQHFYSEGYFLGFMIGLARDYNLNLCQAEVPKNAEEFKLFHRGLNAQPIAFSPSIGANFLFHEDQGIAIQLERWIYEGGLKLWLHLQGLDVNLTNKISHPEALGAFKTALKGEQNINGAPQGSPQDIGYSLGQTAREKLNGKKSN